MTDIDTRSEARRSAERLLTLMQRGTIIEETSARHVIEALLAEEAALLDQNRRLAAKVIERGTP